MKVISSPPRRLARVKEACVYGKIGETELYDYLNDGTIKAYKRRSPALLCSAVATSADAERAVSRLSARAKLARLAKAQLLLNPASMTASSWFCRRLAAPSAGWAIAAGAAEALERCLCSQTPVATRAVVARATETAFAVTTVAVFAIGAAFAAFPPGR
jgi:hypothetical protein